MRSDAIARRAVIRGRVQGVFFRDSARQEAERLGVRGWVRNVPDGTVEAHVEGASAAVEAMLRWLGQGPRMARVDRVDIDEVEAEGLYGGFTVNG